MILKANTSNKIEMISTLILQDYWFAQLVVALYIMTRNENCLISKVAKIKFPVRDGVPILLASESKPIFSD